MFTFTKNRLASVLPTKVLDELEETLPKGVRWDEARGQYEVRLTGNGQRRRLGRFGCLEDAMQAWGEHTLSHQPTLKIYQRRLSMGILDFDQCIYDKCMDADSLDKCLGFVTAMRGVVGRLMLVSCAGLEHQRHLHPDLEVLFDEIYFRPDTDSKKTFKFWKFQEILQRHGGLDQVVCIGDKPGEVSSAVYHCSRFVVKTIKMVEKPTKAELAAQHELLTDTIEAIARSKSPVNLMIIPPPVNITSLPQAGDIDASSSSEEEEEEEQEEEVQPRDVDSIDDITEDEEEAPGPDDPFIGA